MGRPHTYTVLLEPDEEEVGFTATVPALPGCVTQGESRAEALAAAREAIELHVGSLIADGIAVPEERVPPTLVKVTVEV